MDKEPLLERAMRLPHWARIALAIWAARLVEPNFRHWMSGRIYATYVRAIDEALLFAERCTVTGGSTAKASLRVPERMALTADVAADAARATWEDDLDPDARPAGFASSAYAASEAALATSHLLRTLAIGWREHRCEDLLRSLESSLASVRHDASTAWTGSYEAFKAAEMKGETTFLGQLSDEITRLERSVDLQNWTDASGIPWELFCAADPLAKGGRRTRYR